MNELLTVKETDDFLTVREVSVILKKAVKTVYVYFETGIIPDNMVYRFGNSPRIKRKDLMKLIESRKGI